LGSREGSGWQFKVQALCCFSAQFPWLLVLEVCDIRFCSFSGLVAADKSFDWFHYFDVVSVHFIKY
jgi:hypothetical protein